MGVPRHRGPGAKSLKDLRKEVSGKPETSRKNSPPTHRPAEVVDENGMPYTTGQIAAHEPWSPTPYTAFKVLLSARLCAAIWSGISDCDETYNYWEPIHQLLYNTGLQTWEYEPRFALRSYLYLLVHAVPGWIYARVLQPNPMLVFYFLRCLFGFVCAMSEVYFYRGVLREFGANVGRLTLCILVFSAGMFVSSTALLPSTSSMYLTLLSVGAWFNQQYKLAIFFTALSTFLSWPFAALIGLPIAIDIVFLKKRYKMFMNWCVISAVTILSPQLLCDTYYYGKPVFTSLNIVWYNVFTSHGPDLYGTEPASFYLLNGILNFNFVFIFALLVLPVQVVSRYMLRGDLGIFLPDWISQAPLYLWLLVFWTRPHKEERFLFPIYPLICLAAAMVIDSFQKLWYFLFVRVKSNHFLQHTAWLGLVALSLTAVVSLSRITALYQGYHAATDVWMKVNQIPMSDGVELPSGLTTVCMGKEWYRYPSSFFLPGPTWRVGFLRSEFRGQLPKYFPKASQDGQMPTRISSPDFNDMNNEELGRYINPAKCHFIVDLDNGEETERQPRYVGQSVWSVVEEFDFLDPGSSHKFFRAFYVPFVSHKYCKFNKYVLLKRVNQRRSKEET